MYVRIWEFRAAPEQRDAFERAYGPQGDWVRLFRMGEGYLGTELLADVGGGGRYLTLDRWSSKEAFEAFLRSHLEDYREIDRRLEGVRRQEAPYGSYVPVEV